MNQCQRQFTNLPPERREGVVRLCKGFSEENTLAFLSIVIQELQSVFGTLEFALHPEYYEISEQTGQLRTDSPKERAPIAGHPAL